MHVTLNFERDRSKKKNGGWLLEVFPVDVILVIIIIIVDIIIVSAAIGIVDVIRHLTRGDLVDDDKQKQLNVFS